MMSTQRKLWLSDAKTELKEWPKKPLLIWAACLLGSLLFANIAFNALKHSRSALANSVASTQDSSKPEANASANGAASAGANVASGANASANPNANLSNSAAPNQPQELVLVEATETLNDETLKWLTETALELRSILGTGSESEASYASRAGRVAGLAVAMRQSQLANSEDSFWRPISEAIAALERGQRLGEITADSAHVLLTELRAHYVDLRTGARVAGNEPANTPVAIPAALQGEEEVDNDSQALEQQDPQDQDEVLAEGGALTAASLPLSLRMLPWLSLLLPIGCVLYGLQALLNRMRQRHEAYPKKGYTEIAGAQQAQAMTVTSMPENRHAAERKTQAAILQLLDEMEPLSEGDLTYEASVTEDLTGALADSFNHAVHELRRLVKQINRSSVMVRSAVTESRERTLLMARHGAVQAREVSRTSDRLEGMKTEVVSLSAASQQVAEYAQKVAKRSQQAAKSVTETRDALAVMRSKADVAEQSMRRLVNSTKGIESRLSDIKTAAKRTDLLALNSTIHAASKSYETPEFAFDSTGGISSGNTETFSELATDVSSLAGQLKSATNDIDQLSDVIRDEANDSLRAVHETVSQVKMCEGLSQAAKQHLDDIAKAAQALGTAVTDISTRTSLQATGVTEIANNTQVINSITHDTANALTQAVQDLQNLENMSNSLEASVHGFRLPDETVT